GALHRLGKARIDALPAMRVHVDVMDQRDVDAVGGEPQQRLVDRAQRAVVRIVERRAMRQAAGIARAAVARRARIHHAADLGRHHDAVAAEGAQRGAQSMLGEAVAVQRRDVEQRDAGIECRTQRRLRDGLVDARIELAERRAAEAERRNVDAGAAERARGQCRGHVASPGRPQSSRFAGPAQCRPRAQNGHTGRSRFDSIGLASRRVPVTAVRHVPASTRPREPTMASVSFNAVEKNFGAVKVIHGISFDIADGEFLVLVGPSGCGKSTLLRMLAGLEEISGGVVAIDGKKVNDVDSKDRDIAMVFQSYALYPHMSVRDNMGFSLKLRKADAKLTTERVARAAQILNLEPYLDRYPRELSGGQRQRVAMGRAIVRDPKVFLFDEPLSNLDAKLRVQMRSEIKALHQRLGTTTVYVTHDQIEAMTMADRIVVMHDGAIEQIGTPL